MTDEIKIVAENVVHQPNKHGVYVDVEDVELASAGKCGRAIAHVVLCEDGRWRSGYDFRDSLVISGGLPKTMYRQTYSSRQDAISDVERMAREHFEERLKARGCSTGQVRRDARLILAQLEQRAKPKQMDLFA